MQIEDIIDKIAATNDDRRINMMQRMRILSATGAHIRRKKGWRRDLIDKERKTIEKETDQLIKSESPQEFSELIINSRNAAAPFIENEEGFNRDIEKLVRKLPIWEAFGEPTKGIGLLGIGIIIAEAGDLSNYPDHYKLWKRLGLAVIDGIAQGKLWKGAPKEEWIKHGYVRRRRSQVYAYLCEPILKAQLRAVKDENGKKTEERIALGPYGEYYLRYKARMIATYPDISPLWAHRRAHRAMEKRVVRDLWRAWRRTKLHVVDNRPKIKLSAAPNARGTEAHA